MAAQDRHPSPSYGGAGVESLAADASQLLDAAPDGLLVVDDAGDIELVNRQAEVLFGCSREDLIGRPVDDLLPDRFREVHRAHRTRYRAAPKTRAMGAGLTLMGRRFDGTEFPVEISLSPITTRGQVRVVAAVRDVSDRVALERESARIQALLNTARDAVFIIDPGDLHFTYVNQGATLQTGYSREELLERTPMHIAPAFNAESFRRRLEPLDGGSISSSTFTTNLVRRDGTELPVEVALQASRVEGDEHGHAYVAIVRDISERLEAEERLRQAEQELRVFEDRERIARDLHDLVIQRLFAAGMSLQAMGARSSDSQVIERVQSVTDDIDDAIRELRSVIFGLQSARRLGTLRAQILDVVGDERAALGFEPAVQFDGPVEAIADETAANLLASVREALSNVARHAQASSVDVQVSVGAEVELLVRDNGVGFDGRKGEAVGLGNGLRNLRLRAERLGGRCEIESEDGTVLRWRVPNQ